MQLRNPVLAGLACVIGGCASAAAPTIETAAAKPEGLMCAIQVDYGSVCCGLNRAGEKAVAEALARAKGVERAVQWRWGREGERSLCLVMEPAPADRLFEDLAAIKLPHPSNHGFTNVTRAERQVRLEAPEG